MQIPRFPFMILLAIAASAALSAQSPAPPIPPPSAATAPPEAKPTPPHPSDLKPSDPKPSDPKPSDPKPSDSVQPALDALRQTLGSLKLEKWKGGSIRSEADANIASIQKALQGAIPSLLSDADAAPAVVSAQLPAYRSLNALYDVVVHVEEASRVAAPADQATGLQQSMLALDKARRSFGEAVQSAAEAQEKRLTDLQNTPKAQVAQICPTTRTPDQPTPAPSKKAPPKRKKAPAASGATPQSSTPAKPQN